MTPELFIQVANVAALIFSAAAVALGFYVRSTAATQITARCEALELKYENEAKAAAAAADTVRRELDSEIRSSSAALYARINAFGDRLHEIEGKVDDTARRADLFQLSLQLATMSGELKAITARIEAIAESSQLNSAALKRVENHMFHIEGQ